MNPRALVLAALLATLAVFPVVAYSSRTPQAGDYFTYHEVESLGNGTGSYAGYTEQTLVNGTEQITGVDSSGVVSAHYSYSWSWQNNQGQTQSGNMSGDFTFSSVTFLYLNGTDDQTGYVNPTVWFYMDDSAPKGGTVNLLNTEMTVESADSSFYLPSLGQTVDAIYTKGVSSYLRDDEYGTFNAAYTWQAYFDPATGYIIGYDYLEHDTNSSGSGFTYTDDLYVTSTSYALTTVNTGTTQGVSGSGLTLDYAAAIVVAVVVVIAVLAYSISSRRRRTLPRHSVDTNPVPYQGPVRPPPSGPPPPEIDLTPKEPQVQQIVVRDVSKVKCQYCGTLYDSTAEACPRCGAPRT